MNLSGKAFSVSIRTYFSHFHSSIRKGFVSLGLVVLILVLNFIFYSWGGSNAFYLGLEFLLLFTLLVTSFWNNNSSRNRNIAFLAFLTFFSLDLLFALTIVLKEGLDDPLNLTLAFLDAFGIFSSIFWILNQF